MQRVLHIVGSLAAGGMESYIMNLYRHIDRSRLQFDFFCGTDTHYYEPEIKQMGGVVYYCKSTVYGLFVLYRLLRAHPEYKVVHAHRDAMSALFLFVAWLAGVKVRISHSHSTGRIGLAALVAALLKPFLRLTATERWACGTEAGRWLFGKNARFEVRPNAVDCRRFAFNGEVRREKRRELGVADDELLIGHVGRFELAKNHTFLVDTFAEIASRRPARLVCVGEGSLRNSVMEQAARKGLAERCIFTGNRSDVAELLQAVDVIVFPSFHEGFSFAMVEFQAASLPIVCSDAIPHEINLTGLVNFLPLSAGAVAWAEQALCAAQTEGRAESTSSSVIAAAGYDIHRNARETEERYLQFFAAKTDSL